MIYLDYNATTPIDKEVIKSLEPFLTQHFANPSTSYSLGRTAKMAVEDARKKVSKLINCTPSELVFTSSGSESNNTIIKGVASLLKDKGNHIITSKIEHPSVLNVCKYLEGKGYRVTYLPVDEYGLIDIKQLELEITKNTILVSIMHANNETGTIQPIEDIARICKEKGILLHSDASQSVGKIECDVKRMGVDYLTIAGHKLYAPKGIGALYVKSNAIFEPLIHGAGHEDARRAGTENVIFSVALGKAAELSYEEVKNNKTKQLTDYFYNQLKDIFKDKIKLNGHPIKRLPNTLNVSFVGYKNYQILNMLEDVAVSTGSACHSMEKTISPVLKAMNVNEEIALGAIRFSLGRFTTKEEIDTVIELLKKGIKQN